MEAFWRPALGPTNVECSSKNELKPYAINIEFHPRRYWKTAVGKDKFSAAAPVRVFDCPREYAQMIEGLLER